MSMGPSGGIDPTTYRTISGRSTTELYLTPRLACSKAEETLTEIAIAHDRYLTYKNIFTLLMNKKENKIYDCVNSYPVIDPTTTDRSNERSDTLPSESVIRSASLLNL